MPIKTRAASGIEHFDELLAEAAAKAPLRRTVDACKIGRVSVLLASDYATSITGEIVPCRRGLPRRGHGVTLKEYRDDPVKDPVCETRSMRIREPKRPGESFQLPQGNVSRPRYHPIGE